MVEIEGDDFDFEDLAKNLTEDPKYFRQFKKFMEKQLESLTKGLEDKEKNQLKNYVRYTEQWKDLNYIANLTYEKYNIKINFQELFEKFAEYQGRRLTGDIIAMVKMLLVQKKKQEATEKIVEHILSQEIIHTTRDDKISEMWIYKGGIYVPQGRTYVQEYCREILGEAYTTNMCNQVISKIEADTYIEQEEFFKEEDPMLMPVLNGVLDLEKKELLPFTPNYHFFNKLPVEYYPNANCQEIKEFFEEVLNKSEADIKVMQEIFGYCLYRNAFLDKAIMFEGTGRNGKGRTLELLKTFLGPENCSHIKLEELEENQFSASELHKKLANICGDLSKKALYTTGTFKKTTGRDVISADRKFQRPVNFVSYAKQIYSANELPTTYDLTDAFWIRWVIIPFKNKYYTEQTIEEEYQKEKSEREKSGEIEITLENFMKKQNIHIQDPDRLQKITTQQELNGLLNWAIEGLHRLLKNKDFTNSQTIQNIKKNWLRKSASINGFIMDCIEENWGSQIRKTDFKQAYTQYCKHYKLNISSDKAIKESLNTMLGVSEERPYIEKEQVRVWVGIKLKQDWDSFAKPKNEEEEINDDSD